MLALRKTAPAPGLALAEVADPGLPGPGEALLAVRFTGVCGTDLHIDEWTPSYHFVAPALPVTVGHEFSAEVLAVGPGGAAGAGASAHAGGTAAVASAAQLAPGDLVAVRPSVTCGACAACARADFDACTARRGTGVTRDGAFAARVLVPARNCVPVPAGLDAAIATLAEPMTVSHESVRMAQVRAGDAVLVLGPGNIGLGIALIARAAGACVTVAGRHDAARLATARAMAFDDLIDFGDADMGAVLAERAPAGGYDRIFEATGVGAVVAPALAALRERGILVVTGIHAAPVPIDLTALLRRHQQIRGSYRAPEADWPRVLDFMRMHQDTLMPMITQVLPLADAHTAFALSRSRQATKVLVEPDR
jgi:threonine dehydrogenase-like Zn-dependent dehydrogenase